MRFPRSKRFVVLAVVTVAAAAAAAVAIAAVTSQRVMAEGNSLHYRFVKTEANGFDSGWHVHPGLAIVQVQEGSLQIYQGSCTPRTVGAGETYIEVPWEPVRGVATGRVVWTTSLLVNGPDPLSVPLAAYSPSRPNPCPGT